jgi:hypothetical protein
MEKRSLYVKLAYLNSFKSPRLIIPTEKNIREEMKSKGHLASNNVLYF